MSGVLHGVRVVDFSTLLPGPMASLLLAEAGAQVIKIERPGTGDDMRGYSPKFGTDSANFALLNRGKESLALDLKTAEGVARAKQVIGQSDVLIEQFRPGVMARLGLGYQDVKAINPQLIYCSISGYGQTGPDAAKPGHDLNYMAETGCLNLVRDSDGNPSLPPLLMGDIAGGTYPATINILLALIRRGTTGEGAYIDIAMAENLFPLLYWVLGEGGAAGQWPAPGEGLVVGGSPRYQIYRTKDGRHLATANLEEKFWQNFCDLVGLPATARNGQLPPDQTSQLIASLIARKTADDWATVFAHADVCCSIVRSTEEATASPHFCVRGVFSSDVVTGTARMPALPMPIADIFRDGKPEKSYPPLKRKSKQ